MKYNSIITFIYYEDFTYGKAFIKHVLQLPLVMDQGFAQIYQVNEKGFLGIVQSKDRDTSKHDTLISLSTNDLDQEYQRIQNVSVVNLSDIKVFKEIPLRSIFFEDKEGHRFEIQEFLNDDDKAKF